MLPSFQLSRRLQRVVLGAVLAGAAALPAAAQTTVATFNGLTDPGGSVRFVANCYVEAGLRFTVVGDPCGTADSFATWGPADGLYYTGSPALFNNSATGLAIDINAANNALFSLTSISLTPFLGSIGNATVVQFLGSIGIGGSVSRSVSLAGGSATPTNVLFTNFTGLSAVRMIVMQPSFEPYVQFDNVTATIAAVSVVPEPATVFLMGAGLFVVAALRRRRRTA